MHILQICVYTYHIWAPNKTEKNAFFIDGGLTHPETTGTTASTFFLKQIYLYLIIIYKNVCCYNEE